MCKNPSKERQDSNISGTKAGAAKAVATIRKRYSKDYFEKIGKLGGSKTAAQGAKPKGFAANIERAREAGRKGGSVSSRKGVENGSTKTS